MRDTAVGPGSSSARTARRLFAPEDAASLALFRIAFGLLMLWQVAHYFLDRPEGYRDRIDLYFESPTFHFSYPGLEWIQPWPEPGMRILFSLLALAAFALAIGLCTRFAAALFCIGFTHAFLSDQAHYLNHYYLICLLSGLLAIVPAGRIWSIDSRLCGSKDAVIPAWSLWLLRAQIAIPYIYGGVAKLSADWLAGEPMRTALAQNRELPIIGDFYGQPWFILFFVYGGLLLDLLVVPALLWRPTRRYAFVLATLFHLANALLFPIEIFPWMMIAATALFFEPDWPRRVGRSMRRRFRRESGDAPSDNCAADGVKLSRPPASNDGAAPMAPREKLVIGFLAVWLAIQLLAPLRWHLCGGNPSWTNVGHNFAWRMMLVTKTGRATFSAYDPAAGTSEAINLRADLTPFQIARMSAQPNLLHQYARFLKDRYRAEGRPEVEIRVDTLVSLNNRSPQPVVDPNIDLGAQPATWGPPPWIIPLRSGVPPFE